jgi:hypothetical protein
MKASDVHDVILIITCRFFVSIVRMELQMSRVTWRFDLPAHLHTEIIVFVRAAANY